MAVGLAARLGKKGLLTFSLHPGALATNLGTHLAEDAWSELRQYPALVSPSCSAADYVRTAGQVEIQMGTDKIGKDFKFVNLDQGAANHVYCSFSPDLTGR
jgi:hypothetical protein